MDIFLILSEVLSGSLLTSKTDVYSNCDAVIYNGFALANWFVNEMNKATSHSLYYRKLSANSPQGYLPATDDNI